MNLLFLCGKNRLRSPTAEAVFSDYEGIEAIGAGVNRDAVTPVTGDLIEWADVIVTMERQHQRAISKRFAALLRDKRMVVLGIPDNYSFMQPELVQLLVARVSHHLDL